MKVTSIKGFRDILPEESARRRRILSACRGVLRAYGYGEIEIPLMEKGELFSRSVGATSDIVEKEMYAFEDRDGTTIALRPEGTASVVRAYVENGMPRSHPTARLYYEGPMFRRERPQKGRYRQFTQIGAEFFGRDDPAADAETIALVADICTAAGIEGARIEINSLGCETCRPGYRELLAAFGRERIEVLCGDCRNRIDRNPLRLLDCKVDGCREATVEAPMMIDHLCTDCDAHHAKVLELLAAMEVEVHASPRMVRGLDYYCRTAFEIVAAGLGSQDSVGGGGRYDGLVRSLGGPDVPGVGFAFGVERLEMAASACEDVAGGAEILVAPIGEDAAAAGLRLARGLRSLGITVELESPARRLKAQMKRADKIGARYVVMLGETELSEGRAAVRDMEGGTDHPSLFALDAPPEEIVATIKGIKDIGA